jgi:hypothetical protein
MAGYMDWNDTRRAANTPVSAPTHQGMLPAQQQAASAQQAYGLGRAAQRDVYGQMSASAQGQGPSLAQAQAAQASQQNLVNQMQQTAMGRGGSMAAQARQAQGMGSAAAMGLAQQQAQLAMQEQQAAQAAQAQQANLMAGMDLQQLMAAQQAQQGVASQMYAGQMQVDLANRQAAMEQQARNRALGMQLGQMGLGAVANLGTAGAMGMF